MAATKLNLDKPAAAKPGPRKRAARPRRPAAGADPRPANDAAPEPQYVPWWMRRGPVLDRVGVTLLLFGVLLAASMYVAHVENAWNAAVAGAGEPWNDLHRLAQTGSGTLFLWLLIGVYDLLGFRSVTLGEALRNRPNPGREHLFSPMEPEVRAAVIRFYGMIYAAAPIAAAMAWG